MTNVRTIARDKAWWLAHSIVARTRECLGCEISQYVQYYRSNGEFVCMDISYFDDESEAAFSVAIYGSEDKGLFDPKQIIDLNVEEVKLLRELLNRPEVVEMLDDTRVEVE